MTTKKGTVKDRGKSQPVASKEKEVCTAKFLNLGNPLTLSDGRVVKIRDIPLSAWLDNLSTALPVLMHFADQAESASNDELIIAIAGNSVLKDALYSLISHSSGLTDDEVKQLGVTDTLKIILVVKDVVNFEEIKSLFTRLVSGANIPSITGNRRTPAVKSK